MTLAIAAAVGSAVLAGAVVHSAVGFGFALVAAPVLVSALDPPAAVGAMLVLGIAVNALVLLGDRRRMRWRPADTRALLAWSLPGLVAGALVVHAVSAGALRVIVAVAVLAATAGESTRILRARRAASHAAGPPPARGPAGAAAGLLTTATGLNGPPLVIWLSRAGADADEMRHTLAACFLALSLLGVPALLAFGGLGADASPTLLAVLGGSAFAGNRLGRLARPALRRHHRAAALGLCAIAAVEALAAALIAGL